MRMALDVKTYMYVRYLKSHAMPDTTWDLLNTCLLLLAHDMDFLQRRPPGQILVDIPDITWAGDRPSVGGI